MSLLFEPTRVGAIALANRIVMAPLTRDRSDPDRRPTELTVEYYRQRATAGLIVTEGTQVSPGGQGYLDTPGIHDAAQVAAWRRVTDAVHAAGGRIVVQLWHVGRISHSSLLPPGTQPVSSTARPAHAKTFTPAGFEPVSAPRALSLEEIPALIDDYRHAARCALQAGFDGAEIHGANNYLIEQFLRDSINDRDDAYGGSIEHRARLAVEVAQAVADEIGADRTGMRLSPVTPVNDGGQDSAPQALYGHLVERLGALGLAFVHVVEGHTGGPRDVAPFDFAALRARFKAANAQGAWIVNNGYTRAMAMDAVDSGAADAVAFGRPFIGNPDLVRRLRENAELAAANPKTYYGGGAEGYTDYPTLDGSPV
jgi:N-ethylmaleimide reductase